VIGSAKAYASSDVLSGVQSAITAALKSCDKGRTIAFAEMRDASGDKSCSEAKVRISEGRGVQAVRARHARSATVLRIVEGLYHACSTQAWPAPL